MTKFIRFSSKINTVILPDKIDYPFSYTPNTLAKIASKELQEYLSNQNDFNHDFGIKKPNSKNALGKMFGVLIVKNKQGQLGYLAAFSGKLGNKMLHKHFVPPIYNALDKNGFYLKTEEKINEINRQIVSLENDKTYHKIANQYSQAQLLHANILTEEQAKIKLSRKTRKQENKQNNQLNINEEFFLKEYTVYLDDKLLPLKNEHDTFYNKIQELKKQRKKLSAWTQQEIFKKYQFFNIQKETKNLLDIFNNTSQNIPAGAGDCCAPKLFQYAFLNNFTPICMAEFWWGKPLSSSVRKHKQYYAACTGKCKPILNHMLKGLPVEENPIIKQLQVSKDIKIIFEDIYLLVINKPHNLLSVPGKEIEDSVYTRIKNKYPNTSGPLIVHRLDMATSGILLIAKNQKVHKHLQAQFINKTIKKRYVALLNGLLPKKRGIINLPLRVDLNDRPKQLVCDAHGKTAITKWETISETDNKTRVYFYPITGRTHQLRVHAAHNLGLNIAIFGDVLYGTKENRLHLHAENIEFTHPITKDSLSFNCLTPF